MINSKGTAVVADAETFEAAALDFLNAFDTNNYADLVNPPGVNSYPISTYEYYAIRSKSIVDCQKGTRFMDYLIWTQTGSDAVLTTLLYLTLIYLIWTLTANDRSCAWIWSGFPTGPCEGMT